ncbi:MAG: xanthine phosphoribosyltransferase [Solobacterium sp.]|nr:xanthine phosphoribosyltransferase [Solobacterium sp.]
MKQLEEKILREGKVLRGEILKVDSFLNHQVDVAFAKEIGEEFFRLFQDKGVTKILTAEASGIIFGYTAAQAFGNLPLVFAKKKGAGNMSADQYTAKCYSYTRRNDYTLSVAKEYLSSADTVLIIDDFLANGAALSALVDIVRQSGASIAGCGVVIEKRFQHGRDRVEARGIKVISLACIERMEENGIVFAEEE